MTGFGRSVLKTPLGEFIAEISSINRKFLEVGVYLPRELSRFEFEVRKWISERVGRGNVVLRLFFTPSERVIVDLLPDSGLLQQLKNAWIRVAEKLKSDPQEITLSFLLQSLPSVPSHFDSESLLLNELKKCVSEALDHLLEMRNKEGAAMGRDIESHISLIEKRMAHIESVAPLSVGRQRQKLMEKMQEVLAPSAELDDRIMREIALLADRIDIAEELVRARSHIEQFRELIATKERGPFGRKLEFIVQELGREINTMGSKSIEVTIARDVIDCKSGLEKIREQIQNVE